MALLLAEVPVVVGELAGAEAGLLGTGSALISPAGIAGVGAALLLGQALKNYFNDKPNTEELNIASVPEVVTILQDIFWAPITYQSSAPQPPHIPETVPPFPASSYDGVMKSIATWDRDGTTHPLIDSIADKLLDDLANAVQQSAIANGLSDTSKPNLSSLKPGLIDDLKKTASKQSAGASAPPSAVSDQKTADALGTLAGTDPVPTDPNADPNAPAPQGSIASIVGILTVISEILAQLRGIFNTGITINIGTTSACQPIKLCEDQENFPISLNQGFFDTLGWFLQSNHAVNKDEMIDVFKDFFQANATLGNRKESGKMNVTEVLRDKIVTVEHEEIYDGEEINL